MKLERVSGMEHTTWNETLIGQQVLQFSTSTGIYKVVLWKIKERRAYATDLSFEHYRICKVVLISFSLYMLFLI